MANQNKDIEMMRDEISKVYGPEATKWIIKCKNMPTRQVVAIYLKMKEKGKFDKRRKHVKTIQSGFNQYHQMTLWDYGVDL